MWRNLDVFFKTHLDATPKTVRSEGVQYVFFCFLLDWFVCHCFFDVMSCANWTSPDVWKDLYQDIRVSTRSDVQDVFLKIHINYRQINNLFSILSNLWTCTSEKQLALTFTSIIISWTWWGRFSLQMALSQFFSANESTQFSGLKSIRPGCRARRPTCQVFELHPISLCFMAWFSHWFVATGWSRTSTARKIVKWEPPQKWRKSKLIRWNVLGSFEGCPLKMPFLRLVVTDDLLFSDLFFRVMGWVHVFHVFLFERRN